VGSRRRFALSSLLGLALALACTPGGGDAESGESTDTETSAGTAETETGMETSADMGTGEPDPIDYQVAGPHPVGNLGFVLSDPDGLRPLTVELWFPASDEASAEAAAGQSIEAFVAAEPEASVFAALVADAPADCVRTQTASALAPAIHPSSVFVSAAGRLPTVVFSHCHGCARFSSFSLAERLASHGFLVAAVDHAGSTVFEQIAGSLPDLDAETLALRATDVSRVIDLLLDPAASDLPETFVGLADPDRLGVYGHSFGAVTTGKILQDDPRPKAGVAMAAPLENPILPGVEMANIDEPLMLFVAVEDNSITEFGNNAIRTNFGMANTPVWKLEFADTGHFAYSDLAGLSEHFEAGCGEGLRQTDGEPFTYSDPFEVRALAAGRIAAFFALYLLGDTDARAQLEAADPALSIDVRE